MGRGFTAVFLPVCVSGQERARVRSSRWIVVVVHKCGDFMRGSGTEEEEEESPGGESPGGRSGPFKKMVPSAFGGGGGGGE